MVQTYTGDGKGKTTAAFGQALRAAGQGLTVRVYQFLKGGSPLSGELRALDGCGLPIRWRRFDDQIPPLFQKGEPDLDGLKRALRKALVEVREELRVEPVDLVVMDEINVALGQGWLPIEEVLSLLEETPEGVEWVLTGRGAPQALIERADLVTEMRMVKHPFEKGIGSRKGIEY